MRKVFYAALASVALLVTTGTSHAAPPGFYSSGNFVAPFPAGPTVSGYNYYSSPYGYRTFNNYSYTPTPWGVYGYQSQGTYVRPYVNGRFHSVYWNPFTNSYQYGTGTMNTPSFYGFNYFGW